MISKKSAGVWLAILLVLCSISAYQITHHWRLQTDVLALLPQDEQEPMVQTIRHMVLGELGRTALFMVSHAQPQVARHATRALGKLMDTSGLFSMVRWDYSNQPKAFFELYFPLRYRFISPTLRAYLDKDDGYQYFIARLQRELYQPMSSLAIRFLEDDPLLFFPELMKDFGKSPMFTDNIEITDGTNEAESAEENTEAKIQIDHGIIGIKRHGRSYYFIMAQLAANPFAEEVQVQLEASWQKWTNDLGRSFPGIELTYTALVRFASSMRSQMQKDMFLISVGSTAGVMCLIVMIFRSMKQLVVALIPLAVGLWSAVGLSLLLFQELHAFTLVFGGSLIGVCIDYSLHYFAYHRVARQWQSVQTMRAVSPAIALGALTTLLSYIGLGFTPLIGLRQIAVFASIGILVSFFTVIFWSPFLLRSGHPMAAHAPLMVQLLQRFLALWDDHKKVVFICLGIAVGVCLKGFFELQVSDSPLVLKTLPLDLAAQDRFIRDIFGVSEAQQYIIVDGQTPEEVLQRLEKLQDDMRNANVPYGAALGPVLTSFLPSIKRQEENVRSIKKLLVHERDIASALEELGLPERSISHFFQDLQREPGTFLLPEKWLAHDASVGMRNFWLGSTSYGTSVVVKLQNVTDADRIKEYMTSFGGMRYFDHVEDFTRVLERYRRNIMLLVTGSYVFIFALLLWRYRLRGIFVMLPPLLAACMTVGFLGLAGHTFHLLHWLSLLLILGMGIDYTIFLAESDPASELTTFLALTLATVTTILSFGLLSFSSQAALKAIGATTFVGIFCSWLLSPLARYGRAAS